MMRNVGFAVHVVVRGSAGNIRRKRRTLDIEDLERFSGSEPMRVATGSAVPVPAGAPVRDRPGRIAMAKRSLQRLSWETVQKLVTLLIGAIEPVAKLIDAISRLR
jgi:hypothetical protein